MIGLMRYVRCSIQRLAMWMFLRSPVDGFAGRRNIVVLLSIGIMAFVLLLNSLLESTGSVGSFTMWNAVTVFVFLVLGDLLYRRFKWIAVSLRLLVFILIVLQFAIVVKSLASLT